MTDCPRCEELKAKLADIRRELSDGARRRRQYELQGFLRVKPATAKLLMALEDAYPNPVSKATLTEACQKSDWNSRDIDHDVTKVYVCQLRALFGPHAIATYRGFGFALTPIGKSALENLFAAG